MTELVFNKREEKELFFKALLGSPFFNIFASVLATFIVGAIFFKYGGGVPIQVTQTSSEKISTFDAQGEGKVVVIPDQATLSMGVQEQGYGLKQVQERVNKKMSDLTKQLKDLGIDEKNIKTTGYNYYPDWQDKNLYTAYANVDVKIGDLEIVPKALDLIGSLGLDNVSGPVFGLSDELYNKTIKEARSLAIDNAKTKASELSGLAGMKLGRIVNVIEGESAPNYMTRELALPMTGGGNAADKISTPVEAGSSEVVVNVVLSYETR